MSKGSKASKANEPSTRFELNAVPLQDARSKCEHCGLAQFCLPVGLTKEEMTRLDGIVEHAPPLKGDEHLFRAGDALSSIYAVRSGCFKSYSLDRDGDESVIGFHLPGELVGLDAIYSERHPTSAVALDTASVCVLRFDRLAELSSEIAGLQERLFKLMSKGISLGHSIQGDKSAEQRMAMFLVGLSKRFDQRGYSATSFRLAMPRRDMGNYLRLATETVSRVFRRFQDDGLIRVERRELEILDRERLEALASYPDD